MRGLRFFLLLVSFAARVNAQPEAEQPAVEPSAVPEPDPQRVRALELFKQARQHYREGDFQRAIQLLTEAHGVYPEPLLLYNLGRAYESAGDVERSIDAYRRYLEAAPETPDRGAIQQRIVTLQRQLDERARLRRTTTSQPPNSPSLAPWVVAGAGAVVMGVGAFFGVRARSLHDQASDEQDALAAERHQKDAEQAATIASITLLAGGALVVGGVSWGLLSSSGGHSSAGLMLGGRF